MYDTNLPESQYLAGERAAELEALRNDPEFNQPFEGFPCDRCSELYGRVTSGCMGCEWMNNQIKGAA